MSEEYGDVYIDRQSSQKNKFANQMHELDKEYKRSPNVW